MDTRYGYLSNTLDTVTQKSRLDTTLVTSTETYVVRPVTIDSLQLMCVFIPTKIDQDSLQKGQENSKTWLGKQDKTNTELSYWVTNVYEAQRHKAVPRYRGDIISHNGTSNELGQKWLKKSWKGECPTSSTNWNLVSQPVNQTFSMEWIGQTTHSQNTPHSSFTVGVWELSAP